MNDFKNGFIQYGLDHGHIKPIKETIKKYKVKLTFIEEVEATNEQDAIILAYDGVVASGYNDVEVDEIEND
jgi:hypothetical protein